MATFVGLSEKTLEGIEKAAIHATLKSVDGNKTEAAKVLGIAYSMLYEKTQCGMWEKRRHMVAFLDQ